MAFKNNYKDDILDLSVNEKRKYEMTTNADGTVSFNDVTVYEQVGDTLGAKELNEISEKLNISGERIRYNTSNNMVEIMDESGNWNPWSSGISEEFIIKENSILPGIEYKNITINLQGEFVRFISQDSGKIMFYCDLTAYNGKYLRINLKADYEVKVCKCYGISSSYEIIKSIQPKSEFNDYYIPIDGNFDTNYKYLMLIFETYGIYDFKYISITASDGTEGGGGSGGGYSETLLYENTDRTNALGTYNLLDSLLNYDNIVFELSANKDVQWNVPFCNTIPMSVIENLIGGEYIDDYSGDNNVGLFLISVLGKYAVLCFPTEDTFKLGFTNSLWVKRIYGIKY